jgi:crotonobetainyl-CoA:carnitine CoA-transferase CaiB-like acyl-CoA transferase
LELFAKAGIPSGPILTIDKVFEDPQIKHLRMAAPVTSPIFGDTHLVASPVNMSGTGKAIRYPAPEAGANTREVLAWLGYSDESVERLKGAGVV